MKRILDFLEKNDKLITSFLWGFTIGGVVGIFIRDYIQTHP